MCIAGRMVAKLMPATALLILIFAASATTILRAQRSDAEAFFADAPVPKTPRLHAVIKAPINASAAPKHRWLTLDKLSIATLAAGEAIDSWGTYKNMTHTRWVCGNNPAFAGGYDTNVPGAISGLRDVQTVCGTGPAGQSPNWAFDATRVGYFSEGGWATQFHLAGERNYAAVEAWNLVNDVGWALVARRLRRRSDWIGKLGPALNFGRGFVHLEMGIGNFVSVSRHQNPNTLDLYVPKDSNYTSPRWWGKR